MTDQASFPKRHERSPYASVEASNTPEPLEERRVGDTIVRVAAASTFALCASPACAATVLLVFAFVLYSYWPNHGVYFESIDDRTASEFYSGIFAATIRSRGEWIATAGALTGWGGSFAVALPRAWPGRSWVVWSLAGAVVFFSTSVLMLLSDTPGFAYTGQWVTNALWMLASGAVTGGLTGLSDDLLSRCLGYVRRSRTTSLIADRESA